MNKDDLKTMFSFKNNNFDSKEILSLSVPSVSSRIIGNICYFFEPIILTNILLFKGNRF